MTRSKFALRAGAAAAGALAIAALALPAMAANGDITGTKTNNAVGMVQDGDVVTYTIDLDNPSANAQNNVLVQDDPDAGLDYVPGSTDVSVTNYSATTYTFGGTAVFGSVSNAVAWDDLPDAAGTGTNYTSGTGWSSNWTEENDGANSGDNGLVQRTSEDDENALGFTGNGTTAGGTAGPGIIRQFDASIAEDLRLDFQTGGDALDAGDNLEVWYSGDGTTWTSAGTVANSNTEDVARSFDIGALAGDATAYIRIGVATGVTLATAEWWSVDKVIILGVFEDVDTYDNDPGGSNNLADGVADSELIAATDAINLPAPVSINASKTYTSGLTVTYDMMLDGDDIPQWETELENDGKWWGFEYTEWGLSTSVVDFEYEPALDVVISANGPVSTGQPIIITVVIDHSDASDGSPVCVEDFDIPDGAIALNFTGDAGEVECLEEGETWTFTITYPGMATAGTFAFSGEFTGYSVNAEAGDDDVDVTATADTDVVVVLADTGAANTGLAGVAAALVALGAAALVVARRRNA